MNPPFDFEAMMMQGIVFSYARRMAEAWQNQDDTEVERIKGYIEGNYGKPALMHITELAMILVMKGE